MRTHGHREGSTKHWSLFGGKGEGPWEGEVWRDSLGEMSNVGEGEKGSKKHCDVCTYTTVLHVLLMYPKT